MPKGSAAGAEPTAAGLVDLYLDLHRNPELSGSERRTANRLAGWLSGAGYTVTTGVGGQGVVGILQNGPGPVVMLRTELDALPVKEKTGLAYASAATAQGSDGRPYPVMQACGHDANIASVAGAATALAKRADRWRGTVMVVGQPAEETLDGAAAMLADGLYSRWSKPDVVLAQHVAPLPAGLVAHAAGPVTAASASLEVRIHGRGGNPGLPHPPVNPIQVAATIVLALAEASEKPADAFGMPAGTPGAAGFLGSPLSQVLTTVATLHAGSAGNVIPELATVGVSLRAFDDAVLRDGLAQVEQICRSASDAANCPRPPDLRLVSHSPANINDLEAGTLVRAAHVNAFGVTRVADIQPSMATEDFALFGAPGAHLYSGDAVPTVYWMIGSVSPKKWAAAPGKTAADKLAGLPPTHSPAFAPDPVPTLQTGTAAMVAAALAFLVAK